MKSSSFLRCHFLPKLSKGIKKYFLPACLFWLSWIPLQAQLKLGSNATRIYKSSILELESNSQGILLPRLKDTSAINALVPPDGTLIYLTNSNPLSDGLYIRTNNAWKLLASDIANNNLTNLIVNVDSTVDLSYNGKIYKTNINITGRNAPGTKEGRGIENIVINSDSTISFLYTDGTQFTSTKRIIGRDGTVAGHLLSGMEINNDSTITLHYTDHTSDILSQKVIGRDGKNGSNGRGITDIKINADSSISILYTDGSLFTSSQKIVGRDGPGGRGIKNILINADSSISILFTDGGSFTSSQKIVGKDGANGRGIQDIVLNADSSLTLTYTDGTFFHSSQKIIGKDGANGRGIQDIQIGTDSLLSLTYTDGTSFHSSQKIVGKDGGNGIGILWQGSLGAAPSSPGLNWAYYDSVQHKSFLYDGSVWQLLAKDGQDGGTAGSLSPFNGNRPITAAVFNGQNPGTNDLIQWIETLFYPSQGPTAGLTMTYLGTTSGSFSLEQMSPGADLAASLNWSAGRQASTATLSNISVAGVAQTFSQPLQGASVSGNKTVTIVRNANTSFSNTVTTLDNKTANASVSMNFFWKRYYGFLTGPSDGVSFSPTGSEILSLTQAFGTAKNFTANLTPSGSQRIVIAYPAFWDGTNTQLIIGGLDQTGAFERTVRSFTNASGATINYVVYTSINNTSGSVNVTIQ